MNEQAKPTPGPWEVRDRTTSNIQSQIEDKVGKDEARYIVSMPKPPFAFGRCGALVTGDDAEAEANAALIAVAGTVYHETGLTPRQLAEQRKELMDALHKIAYEPIGDARASAVTVGAMLNGCIEIARAALAHARGEKQP